MRILLNTAPLLLNRAAHKAMSEQFGIVSYFRNAGRGKGGAYAVRLQFKGRNGNGWVALNAPPRTVRFPHHALA